MWFIFKYISPRGPHTSSIGVAALGSPTPRGIETLVLILEKVLNCRYDLIKGPILFPSQVGFSHWRKSRGGGCIPPPPPHFFGWGGDGLYKYPPPPLFEDKITLDLTFIVKKLTFLTVELLKTPKIARSLRSLAHKCILRLDLCGFASTCILFLTSFLYIKVYNKANIM